MAVMDRDRWKELAPLLDRALDLGDDERAAWLGELRSRTPALAAELAALLAGEAAADQVGFLDGPVDTGTPQDALAGAELGAYLQACLGDTYSIERELGGGGMSRVFLARELALGRAVVIKVLLPVLAAGIRTERFAREVRVAAALQHPNVVPLYAAGEAAGLPYYVMPYVKGESLRSRLTREGRLALADVLSILRDVARALAFAHEQGVVHRDVKPENVLLAGDPSTGSGQAAAVVTDFGVAKAVAVAGGDHRPALGTRNTNGEVASHGQTLSAIGSTIGTPAYMSPEQATGEPGVDHRADVYAWGVLAYELLAGRHPFADRTSRQELLAAHLSETPSPLSRFAPDISPTLAGLVMRCLEKNPALRPQSVREIMGLLATVATPSAGVARRWPRRVWTARSTLFGGAGLLSLALAAYVVTTVRRDGRSASLATAAPSLAVLSFDDTGGDSANAYFGDGIADEISTALSKVGGLRVASRTSAAAYRSSRDVDVRELGRRLGVNTVLEGRVRRDGDRMRLTVQLTSVADGLAVWSDVYERKVNDVFAVQDEIARSVVGALRPTLRGITGPQPRRSVSSPGTTNLEAYDLYLRATFLLERRGKSVATAVEYFERAIQEDSTFARAYAGLSYALELMPAFGGTPARTVERRALDAAHHALALDSTLAEAYTAIGLAYSHAYRWKEASDALQRAVAADPGYAPGEYHYAHYLMRHGRLAEAEEFQRRARNADPLSATASAQLALLLSLRGQYDESVAESRRAYELDSSLASVRALVFRALLADGRPEQARTLARRALPMPFNGMAAYVLGVTGDRAAAAATVRELEARPHGEWNVASALTYAYLGVGDTARALSSLDAAASDGEIPLPLVDPMFDPVRQSARFAAAVRHFGLPEGVLTSPTVRRH